MLDFDIGMSEEGMTVPYKPIFDTIRKNYGFVDVRGRPDLASRIPESKQSLAMRKLLEKLSAPESRLFTVGCDLGSKPPSDDVPAHAAGGYVQVMSADYATRTPEDYERFALAIAGSLETHSEDHEWKVQFVLTPVQFKLDGFNEMTGSLWIWFHAFSNLPRRALKSREALIIALDGSLMSKESFLDASL